MTDAARDAGTPIEVHMDDFGKEYISDVERVRTLERSLTAARAEAELIDLLEVYMVNGAPRFAIRGYPGGPDYFMSAREACDAALAARRER